MLEKEQNKIVTIPNILSTIRLILIIPTAYYLWNDHNFTAGLLTFISGLIDVADGNIARKFNMKSELGKILDPLADKLFIAMLIIILTIKGVVPIWFMSFVVIRDLLIILGGIYAARRIKIVIPSNLIGKLTALTLAVALLIAVLNYLTVFYVLMYLSTVLMIVSLAIYGKNMLDQLKEAK